MDLAQLVTRRCYQTNSLRKVNFSFAESVDP